MCCAVLCRPCAVLRLLAVHHGFLALSEGLRIAGQLAACGNTSQPTGSEGEMVVGMSLRSLLVLIAPSASSHHPFHRLSVDILAQAETERQSFSMPCTGCKTWVKGWRHYTHVQGQFFCAECVRQHHSALLFSSAPSGDGASEFKVPGADAGHLKAGGGAAERVMVPRCRDLFGACRSSWTVPDTGGCWDCFGFMVNSGTWVVMNVFDHAAMCIAEVDYLHGMHLGAEARVQLARMALEEETVRLREVCTLRSVRHWLCKWRRFCRRKREKRLASRLMLQYCRGVADPMSIVHSFL